jgi:hypothetical protein
LSRCNFTVVDSPSDSVALHQHTKGVLVSLALGAALTTAGCGASGHDSRSTTPTASATSSTVAIATSTSTSVVVLLPPCLQDPDMPRCSSQSDTVTCPIYVRNPGCPYGYIDANTGMLVVDAPNGETYQIPVNSGSYIVEPDGSIVIP